MMQQAHLTRWQSEAPWPMRSQIEQDLRISRGVAAIFRDSYLSEHLAMRGGTILHKGHLAPAARYSEDIDLVLIKNEDLGKIDAALRRVLTPFLGAPTDSIFEDVKLAIRNAIRPSKIIRTEYRFTPVGLRYEANIKVEVNTNESQPIFGLVDVGVTSLADSGEVEEVSARSYDINEMLGTKTRALLQRHQGRDLFDLVHAWKLSSAGKTPYQVDGAKAMDAFAFYMGKEGVKIGEAEANKLLDERLKRPSFRRDMKGMLRPGLDEFDVDSGAILVRERYFRHLV